MDNSDTIKLILTLAPLLLVPLFNWFRKRQTGATLFNAVIQGDTDSVRKLLVRHANYDAADSLGMTPLMYASIEGHVEIAGLLIARGANIHAQSVTGMTALAYAEANSNTEIAHMLGDAGAIN